MYCYLKLIIYQGEWVFGKIHGKGIYYYRYNDPSRTDTVAPIDSATIDDKSSSASGVDKSPGTSSSQGSLLMHSGNSDAAENEKAEMNEKQSEDVTSKSFYEGEFKENMRQGMGTYVFRDGSVYSGMWQNNMMTGRGFFTWPDGSTFEGEWKFGKRDGPGLLRASDGFIYDGTWLNNTMEGRGTAIYPSGQQYNGTFHNGCKDGRGTLIFTNGAVYEGRFRNDCIDGQGTLKITQAIAMPVSLDSECISDDDDDRACTEESSPDKGRKNDADISTESSVRRRGKFDIMIPISFQSDMGNIHRKAGFTMGGE